MARQVALEFAEQEGRLLAPPFGDVGITVETSREIVKLLSHIPLGDQKGVVVVGPMDEAASVAALDALLKTLEEVDGRYIQPVLWARDVGDVRSTIRSRSIEQWCPGPEVETSYVVSAKRLCEASLERREASVLTLWGDNKGVELEILQASANVLATTDAGNLASRLMLWERIRSLLVSGSKPVYYACVSAYLMDE